MAAATALVAAIALIAAAARAPAHAGFLESSWAPRPGHGCDDSPPPGTRERWVREPAILGEARPAGCWRWRSHYVARRRELLQPQVESTGEAVLTVDGASLLTVPGGGRAERFAERDIPAGTHEVVLRLAHPGGPAYVRMFALAVREPYLGGTQVLDLRDWVATREHAERALQAPRRDRPELALIVFTLLALAGVLTWLSLRVRRGEAWPRTDLAWAIGITVLGGLLRVPQSLHAEVAWDELSYVTAGEHYVRNLVVGDWTTPAWRWNLEHPPHAKWVIGLGSLLGDFQGARVACAMLATLAIGLVYATARTLLDRHAAIAAAVLFAVTPQVVGFSRLCTHEAIVLFFWSASMLAAARWMLSAGFLGSAGPAAVRAPYGAPLPAFLAAFLSVLGTASRATHVWIVPLLLASILLVAHRRGVYRRTLRLPAAAIAGAVVGVSLTLAVWPWLWPDPRAQFADAVRHFEAYTPSEHYLGAAGLPPRSFFAHAFVATTPVLHLIVAGIGVVWGLWRREHRATTVWLVLALLLPFGQSLSHVRQDLARYVVQAWVGLALLGGSGLAALAALSSSEALADVRRARHAGTIVYAGGLATTALVALIGLHASEPYPTVYFGAASGGAPHVAATRSFELGGWGEGQDAATAWVNEHAGQRETVSFSPIVFKTRPRLRDDLDERPPRTRADWILRSGADYELDATPLGCRLAHEILASGAPVARVFDCR